jgi:hypothetical protein
VASPPERLKRTGDSTPFSRPDNRNGRASRRGWGAVCQGVKTGGLWSQMEQKLHMFGANSSGLLCREEFHQGSIMCPREASHGQHYPNDYHFNNSSVLTG